MRHYRDAGAAKHWQAAGNARSHRSIEKRYYYEDPPLSTETQSGPSCASCLRGGALQLAARPIHCIWLPPNRLHDQRLDFAPHGLLEQIRFLGQVDLHGDVCHVPEPLVDLVARASDEPLQQHGQMPDRRTTLV
jgi:hypothetical protein